ncbi:MAG: hypothetical protein GY861_07865 [bacterium]|nr:hypothetical protein [bacterium]
MIEFIKAKNHKGIKELKLLNLGCVNVICGKNSSGKTSILEAITNNETHAIGIRVDNLELLEEIFTPYAKAYTSPSLTHSIDWFTSYISSLKQKNTTWFSDDKNNIVKGLTDDMKNHQVLRNHNPDIFKFHKIVDAYFETYGDQYRPVLIPPQRTLETKNQIQLNQSKEPSGKGLLNRLFYLKNQDIESEEYKTFLKIYKAFSEITEHKFNIIPDESNTITIYFKREECCSPSAKWDTLGTSS